MSNDSNKMIRIGFVGYADNYWLGGFNYLKNLLYAIKTLNDSHIHITLFLGEKVDLKIVKELEPYVDKIVNNRIFDKGSLQWLTLRIGIRILKRYGQINRLLIKNRIDILSHSGFTGKGLFSKTISWIADFQHIHLPHMFSKKEIKARNRFFFRIAKDSDCIILSSFDAYKDLSNFTPEYVYKAKVLHFVTQPFKTSKNCSTKDDLLKKYNINRKYFYLPNQFWKHKNHITAFKAIDIIKDKCENVLLVCSGNTDDYRNKDHIKNLEDYIKRKNLENNIRFLGIIDYDDVINLMRYSICIINPSLFEGWSSTVEESKSLDHRIVLSDIAVHKEQNPEKGIFFNKNDTEELSKILIKLWDGNKTHYTIVDKIEIDDVLAKRTKKFAQEYEKIIFETVNKDD